jgi:trans-aconitate methyltransferase
MIKRAKEVLPDRDFQVADLTTYTPDPATPVEVQIMRDLECENSALFLGL